MTATLLDRLFMPGAVATWVQPVIDLRDEAAGLHAIECLVRGPADTNLAAPDVLFDYVRRKRHEQEVDRLCLERVLAAVAGVRRVPKVNLNVHASTLERDAGFASWLRRRCDDAEWPARRVTVEIVEHAPAFSGPEFLRRLDELRSHGFGIALDDVGLGQSNFRMILECRPDYLKLDRHFVHGAAHDAHRRAVLGSIVYLARRTGAEVVAEGVEDERDADAAYAEGVHLLQGYLFSPPLPVEAFHVEAERIERRAKEISNEVRRVVTAAGTGSHAHA